MCERRVKGGKERGEKVCGREKEGVRERNRRGERVRGERERMGDRERGR